MEAGRGLMDLHLFILNPSEGVSTIIASPLAQKIAKQTELTLKAEENGTRPTQ